MSPTRRACISALGVMCVALGAAQVTAQVRAVSFAPGPPDFTFSPLERSTRLQGLGGMIYVVEDENNQVGLWDFARNPAGLLADRDSSVLEAWSSFDSKARYRNETFGLERQSLSQSDFGTRLEAWRRTPGKLFYGAEVRYRLNRLDQPVSDRIYQRDVASSPTVSPTLGGRLKWVESGRMTWALRLHYRSEDAELGYRLFRANASGIYMGGNEDQVPPPNAFDADEGRMSGLGGGGALAYKVGRSLDVSVGGDFLSEALRMKNLGDRYSADYNQDRPVYQGQLAMVGRVGKDVEWGVDGRLFRSSSEQKYVFTISAGIGGIPLAARGKRLEADENGSSLRTRVLVRLPGGFRLAGGGGAVYSRLQVTPPDSDDLTSYNLFLNRIYSSEPDADSLALPDSVSHQVQRVHAYQVGGGLSWEGAQKWLVGVEYHFGRDRRDQRFAGVDAPGPDRRLWDVRAGLEYRCNDRLLGRAGYAYRRDDADAESGADELLGQTVTLGAGYRPRAASWTVEGAYSIEWVNADFEDPTEFRGGNQSVGLNLRWRF